MAIRSVETELIEAARRQSCQSSTRPSTTRISEMVLEELVELAKTCRLLLEEAKRDMARTIISLRRCSWEVIMASEMSRLTST